MEKFWTLVIMVDLSLKRIWTNNQEIAIFMKANEGVKVYRISNSQEAVMLTLNDQVLWQDINEIKVS